MASSGTPKIFVAAAVSLSCYAAYMFSSGSRRRRRSYAESSAHNKERAEDILAEIDEIDITMIELEPHALKYIQTIDAYLNCFDELEDVYNDLDPSHKLAGYEMPDMNLPTQQLSMGGGLVSSLDELYEVAEAILPLFITKISNLLERVNADDLQLKLPRGEKLKRKQRASEKAIDEYSKMKPGPSESWLRDIVRGSVEFNDAGKLLEFLKLVRSDASIQIVKSTNHFCNPTLSGYRDWNLKLLLSSEDRSTQHICELQLHLSAFKEAGVALGSLDYYEFFRIFAGTLDNLEDRMDDLRLICKGGSLNMAFLGNVMKHPLEQDRMIRLADLFESHVNDSQLAILVTNAMRKNLELKDFYMTMGNLFRRQGNVEEAMTLFQAALDIQLNDPRRAYVDTVDMYNSMANFLMDQGKVDEAMVLFQKALDIQLNVIGPDTIDKAQSYNNMGDVLHNQGNFEDALAMHQKALSLRLKEFGPNHAETAETCASMVTVLQNQGKLNKSFAFQYQAALNVFLKTLGPDHVDTAHDYAMATVLNEQDKRSDESGTVERSARSRRRSLKKPKKNISSLAEILSDSVNFVETNKADDRQDTDKKGNHEPEKQSITPKKRRARKRMMFLGSNLEAISEDSEDSDLDSEEEAMELDTCNSVAGEGRPEEANFGLKVPETGNADTASAYMNMAIDREKHGEKEEAMDLYRKALDMRLEVLGLDNAETADAYFCIANLLQDQGKLEEAVVPFQKALDIRLKVLEPDHDDTINVCYNMASVREREGKLEEAAALYQQVLDARLKVRGFDHEETADAFFDMANVLQDQGKLDDAIAMYQKALGIRLKVLGSEHAGTAQVYNNMGYTLCKQNKLDEALDLCQKALYIDLQTLGEDHSSTAVTFHNLAEIFFNQGRLEKAMALCQHALAIYWRTLGPGHPSTGKAKDLMDVIQNVMNENCVKKRREEGLYHGWANQVS